MLKLDELYKMDYDQLIDYFDEVDADTKDFLALLEEMGFRRHKGKLKDFVARQICETALFLKVASD
jgi:hypothetical protein